VKLDDAFWTHPKLEGLSDRAHRLFVRSIGYASQHMTDGVLNAAALRTLGADARTSRELCTPVLPFEVGVWEPIGSQHKDGYRIHDYLDFNPSRDEVLERRRQAAARQAKKRDKANKNPDTGRYTA
jgi:hypothetical protein